MSENNEKDEAEILSFDENENSTTPTEKAFEEIDVENMSENLEGENPETQSSEVGENEVSELDQLKAEALPMGTPLGSLVRQGYGV